MTLNDCSLAFACSFRAYKPPSAPEASDTAGLTPTDGLHLVCAPVGWVLLAFLSGFFV